MTGRAETEAVAQCLGATVALFFALLSAGPAAAADRLYEVLLTSTLEVLPEGVSGARLDAAPLSDDDRKDGVAGSLSVRLRSNVGRAGFQYLIFANAQQAAAYTKRTSGWFDAMTKMGSARPIISYDPAADCIVFQSSQHMFCIVAVDRVVIITLAEPALGTTATEPTTLAGPLLKAATDHLATVKAAAGTR